MFKNIILYNLERENIHSDIDDMGYVFKVSDDIVYARGLLKAQMSELVHFENINNKIVHFFINNEFFFPYYLKMLTKILLRKNYYFYKKYKIKEVNSRKEEYNGENKKDTKILNPNTNAKEKFHDTIFVLNSVKEKEWIEVHGIKKESIDKVNKGTTAHYTINKETENTTDGTFEIEIKGNITSSTTKTPEAVENLNIELKQNNVDYQIRYTSNATYFEYKPGSLVVNETRVSKLVYNKETNKWVSTSKLNINDMECINKNSKQHPISDVNLSEEAKKILDIHNNDLNSMENNIKKGSNNNIFVD